jgi:gentisate 1,2-dioxygenase
MALEPRNPEEARLRRRGHMHWHDSEVRHLTSNKILHKNPAADQRLLSERNAEGREAEVGVRTLNVFVASLQPGQATRLHKHHNEAVMYIIQGRGYCIVQGRRYDWEGDVLYMPTFQWHTHVNPGPEPVVYLAVTNQRMLDWLGLDRMVQAGIDVPLEAAEKEIATEQPSPYSWYSAGPDGVQIGTPEWRSEGETHQSG